ncbi:uncharacterized protein LOC123529898 [Mercenaria mercenaria]|uniref:uncharacterized protein LOC123529898 n=1 Tax=Mercenaria mercenaria TaxID=6596 RepID=UPI00234F3F7F|nr:uncharacterized protein LOC123529898 [Mercenaria mercenaria]
MEIYRCRKCRQNLEVQNSVIKDFACCDVNSSQSSVLYLDVDTCPEWIVQSFEQASWIKGKLLCLKCKGRLGSFDFVNQKSCTCQQHTIPVAHLLTNRIDHVQKRVIPVVQYRDSKMANTSTGYSCSSYSICTATVPIQKCEENNAKTDIERDKSTIRSEHSERNSIILHDRHVPQNCCGQVDSFDNPGMTLGENFQSLDGNLCEADLSNYNKFDVLNEVEADPDDAREENDSKEEGKETDKEVPDIPTELTCAVCLEMFYRPHHCDPCNHIFCEHCLRQVCRQKPTLTPCPLCREVIRKCVFRNDLTELINTQYGTLYKERRHELRKRRKDNYPLPSCTPGQHLRYMQRQQQQSSTTPWTYRREQNFIIQGCFQEILVRFAWLLLIFLIHNTLFHLDTWLMWDVYAPFSLNFNSFLLALTCKLVLFGIIYCVKKYFYIHMENEFMGQAVLFVFIFSVLWDNNSWIQSMLSMVVLGSLFL